MSLTASIEIEATDGSKFTTTSFQLLQWKHALKLEKVGMTMSRGKVSTHLKKLFVLKRTTKIEELQAIVEDILEQFEEAAGIQQTA